MTSPAIVAVLEPGYADYETEGSMLARFGARILPVAAEDDIATLRGKNVAAALVRERRVDGSLFSACPDLKLVLRYGVGVDNVDIDLARERRIYVANIPDYGAEQEVSDHAAALYLAASRRVVTRDREVRRGVWNVGQSQPIYGHRAATLGLIGFGKIARAACLKFRALGFRRVLAADPLLNAETAQAADVEISDVDTICREADTISLHAPLNDSTHHIIDSRRIRMMKPTAILVNVSRGGLVDEAALAEALCANRLFGAGIDVFETEPPRGDNPLLTAPNTVLSDHNAWYSEASVRDLQSKAAAEVARVLSGKPPLNWVNQW